MFNDFEKVFSIVDFCRDRYVFIKDFVLLNELLVLCILILLIIFDKSLIWLLLSFIWFLIILNDFEERYVFIGINNIIKLYLVNMVYLRIL